jgi:multidrug efflux system membrane fusion protein
MPPPGVSVAQPQVAAVTNWDEYPGHLEAVESVEIRPRVSGYIESIHFSDGAEVRAGDLLFVIDPKPYQADLDRARAEGRRAETQLELARNDLQRAESLRGSKAISEEEFDTRSKAARLAEDALAAVKAAAAVAELNLGYARVTAPIGGKIGRRLVTAGNLVQGGGMVPGTVLATVVSLDPSYCYFDVDEPGFQRHRANGLGLSGSAQAQSPLACELALTGEEGFPHKGQVDFFDNQLDRKTGTIRMRGVFGNADRGLVPGMFGRIRLPVERIESALLIPEAAIASEQTRKFVYVLNAEQVVEPRPIQLGRSQGTQRIVLAGLKPDDRVVVSGLLMLRPGIKVQVVDPKAPTGQAGSPARP